MGYGRSEMACNNFREWPKEGDLCGRCAWPKADHKEKQMQPHQERVVTEKKELDEKIEKLKAFFDNPIYLNVPEAEGIRLQKQFGSMEEYSKILGERIAAF